MIEDLARYSVHGFDAIGLWRLKMDDIGTEQAIDAVHDSGLRVSSLHWAGGFTGSDGRSFKESVNDALDAIRVASQLSAGCLLIYPGGRNGHTERHAMRLFCSAINRLLPMAEDLGVTLAVEPMLDQHQSADWTFFHSFKRNLDLVTAFDHSNLKMALDLFHVGFDLEILDRVPEVVQHLALIQLADRAHASGIHQERRMTLGSGGIEIGRWIERLESAGYRGEYELELHGCDVDYFDLLTNSMSYVKTMKVPENGILDRLSPNVQ